MAQRWLIWLAAAALVGGCSGGDTRTSSGGGSETGDGTDGTDGGTGSGTGTGAGTTDGTGDTTGDDTGTDATGDDTTTGAPDCALCNDENDCTKDVCNPDGSCDHLPIKEQQCRPSLVVTAPSRGATLGWQSEVTVTGQAVSAFGGVDSLKFGGVEIPFGGDGGFSATIPQPSHGVNLISIEAEDVAGKARHVQSFLMGEHFYDTLDGPTAETVVSNGLAVFLGAKVWDDNDLSDVDDVATLVHFVLGALDIVSLIPSPLTTEGESPGVGWCEWVVTVNDIQYTVSDIDLNTSLGGLALNGTLQDVLIDFDAIAAGFGCPDAIGTAYATQATMSVFVGVKLDASGEVIVTVDDDEVEVVLSELEFDITGGAASAFDFLFNWFSGTIAGYIEGAVKGVLVDTVAPLIGDLLTQVANMVITFDIPPFLGGTQSVPVTFTGKPSTLVLDLNGALVGLGIGATTPKAASWLESPGSLARSGCFGGAEPAIDMPTSSPVSLAIHDDLINQAIFAAWWGGILNVTVDQDVIDMLLPDLPVDGITVSLDPLAPPVLTSCTQDNATQLHLGDLKILTTFDFEGEPAGIEAYVTAAFQITLDAEAADGATIDLSFEVEKLVFLDYHLVGVEGAIESAENLLNLVVRNVAQDLVVELLGSGLFNDFPVPAFDLSTILPGLPIDTVLTFDPSALERVHGYTVLSGTIVD